MYNRHIAPDPYAIELRTAHGKRHSAADQAHLDKAHELLDDEQVDAVKPRAALLRNASQIVAAAPVRSRAAIPDAYEQRHLAVSEVVSADLDPRYQPLGVAPDGYLLGLAAKRIAEKQ